MLILWTLVEGDSCFAQQGKEKTNKVVFHLNNLKDKAPDLIKIHTPPIGQLKQFETNQGKIHLIGEVLDTSGLEFISVNSEMLSLNENGFFTAEVVLQPGANQIEFILIDKNKKLQDQYLTILYSPNETTLADKILSESKYYGLIIGINAYADSTIPDLDHPIHDAENLYHTLTEHYMFNHLNTRLLKNPSREEIIDELDHLSDVVTAEDNVLIFFAGHGSYDEKGGYGFWWPADARRDSKAGWLRNSTLVEYLDIIDSKHTLLISDACFSGSIFKTRSVNMETDHAFERIYDLRSRKAMTSGAKTEVPDDSEFIKYLIIRLKDNEEVYLRAYTLFGSIFIAVASNTTTVPQFGDIQNVGHEGGDFIFLKRR